MQITMAFKEFIEAFLNMSWILFWPLMLGFIISGFILAAVPKRKMRNLLGHSGFNEILLATFFGSVSSSCSYAAASMSKSLFEKGADIICALAFLIASTNLVFELSFVLWATLGFRFVVAEFVGGLVVILVMSILMKSLKLSKYFSRKQKQLDDTSDNDVEDLANLKTKEGWIKVSSSFVTEFKMIWKDIALGLGLSAAIMICVPESFWRTLFLTNSNHSTLRLLENAALGPLVSALSFVCSVGNIPLAGALFHDGIGFAGTLSFIFADLLIVPLILVYKKYYGTRAAVILSLVLYLSMVISSLIIESVFKIFDFVPVSRPIIMKMSHDTIKIDSTFWLNFIFLVLSLTLAVLARDDQTPLSSCCKH